jgi:hypothetical protein
MFGKKIFFRELKKSPSSRSDKVHEKKFQFMNSQFTKGTSANLFNLLINISQVDMLIIIRHRAGHFTRLNNLKFLIFNQIKVSTFKLN